MIRIFISTLLILATIIYCVVEKNNAKKIFDENCIEVYLYKEPILPENCIWYRDSKYYKKEEFDFIKEFGIIDTIDNSYSQGGKFKNDISKIEEKPIINNKDIISFKLKESNFKLNQNNNFNKFIENNKVKHLKQFAITINKKPVLNGYFFNIFSSSVCNSNQIIFIRGKKKNLELLIINYNNKKVKPINLKKDYPELYQAFKNTNRLVE